MLEGHGVGKWNDLSRGKLLLEAFHFLTHSSVMG